MTKIATPNGFTLDDAGQRIVVDPICRIEGHLRIEAEIDGGQVSNAWSSSTMFRGIEIILQGRDPRDAWAFTQRICGVCTTVHAIVRKTSARISRPPGMPSRSSAPATMEATAGPGTANTTTSPWAMASAPCPMLTLPVISRTLWTRDSFLGSRTPNTTSWLAPAHFLPSVPPMLPAPTIPIFTCSYLPVVGWRLGSSPRSLKFLSLRTMSAGSLGTSSTSEASVSRSSGVFRYSMTSNSTPRSVRSSRTVRAWPQPGLK